MWCLFESGAYFNYETVKTIPGKRSMSLLEVNKMFVQFHCLMLYRNDLYWKTTLYRKDRLVLEVLYLLLFTSEAWLMTVWRRLVYNLTNYELNSNLGETATTGAHILNQKVHLPPNLRHRHFTPNNFRWADCSTSIKWSERVKNINHSMPIQAKSENNVTCVVQF